MKKIKISRCVVAGLCCLPLVSLQVFAVDQDDRRSSGQGEREVSKLSKIQRSGYLGKVSERVILSGNLEVLGSISSYSDFFEDQESLKEHVKLWHRVAIDAVALDHTPDPNSDDYSPSQGGPTRTSRALAMVQIAVFDTLNSIDERYHPYTAVYDGYSRASSHAAVAYAAHAVLLASYPQQAARLNGVLSDTIRIISGFSSDASMDLGESLGAEVSAAIRSERLDDGSTSDEPNFGEGGVVSDGIFTHSGAPVNSGGTGIGEWTPDPNTPDYAGDYNLSLGAYWGGVDPFFLSSGNQFRVAAPPNLDSEQYVQAYNYVAGIGGAQSNTGFASTASDDTRFIANYWGYDGVPLIGVPPRVYNQIVSQVAEGELDDALEYARVLALANVGMADAAIAAWDSKYYYNLWRPVTGIRADDGVDATITDPTWNPIGVSVVNTEEAIRATPPFPAYPSGHAAFGAVAFEILRTVLGDSNAFTFVSDEYNGEGVDPFFPDIPRPFVPVRFSSLSEAQQQNGISRVYNGVHWDFDDTAGQAIGEDVAEYLMMNVTAFTINEEADEQDRDGDRDNEQDDDRGGDNNNRNNDGDGRG